MKKNLISIFLFVGAVTLNLSMLSQARCVDGHKGMQVSVAAAADAEHDSVVTHSNGQEVKASGSDERRAPGVKCVCGGESPGVHMDFNLIVAAIELPPKGQPLQAIQTAVSVFANADPVPQDRPPKPLA